MHNTTSIKIFLSFSFIVGTASATSWMRKTPAEYDKSLSLRPHNEILIRTKKLKPEFEITLTNPGAEESLETSELTLTAQLQTDQNIPKLHYKWIIPDGVQAIAGTQTEGTLSNINSRDGLTWPGTFKLSTSENEKIHLRVWVDDDTNKQVSSAQYNTRLQNEIDLEKSELADRQNEYLADHPELLKKYK